MVSQSEAEIRLLSYIDSEYGGAAREAQEEEDSGSEEGRRDGEEQEAQWTSFTLSNVRIQQVYMVTAPRCLRKSGGRTTASQGQVPLIKSSHLPSLRETGCARQI